MEDKDLCVQDCQKCSKLVESRSQIVNGVGPTDADILLIGEAPGEKEDETGKPFMGRSGDVLDKELNNRNIERDNIRITNTVRCRPPDNRDPYKSEINNCNQYLINEISYVDPDVILTLGRVPTKTILDTDMSVTNIASEIRDKKFNDKDVKVVAGIHPAATLYDPNYKELFSDCIKAVKKVIED